ncbi:serine/threonine-protein kinase [Alteromonas sp. ASW11-130]|uniref:serine/threonine-protein kinase n=1 Tax=Alteromonas sp. ASW11-130 TaxID=3015775 RepID=UPI0022418B32|nr:serine/threonine-protein kinase [Alteromonas sp. ASW11-130]MCW8092606.1 protein kinase [Alteromonas sp. ASW11-130]
MTESHDSVSLNSLETQQLNSTQLSSGTVLAGRFTIREKLGAGAQAAVYHAFDELLQVDIALKLIEGVTTHSTQLQTIRTEVVVARKLNHPNIIRVHDVFADTHHMFFTMAYVEGEALCHRLQKPVSKSEYLTWSNQLLDAVYTCRQANVLHGDIKPDNILIDSNGKLVLIDFGIGQHGVFDKQTSGHKHYSAPEVLHGAKSSTVADTYSVGKVLHEILECVTVHKLSLKDRWWHHKQRAFLNTLTHRLASKRPEIDSVLVRFNSNIHSDASNKRYWFASATLLCLVIFLAYSFLSPKRSEIPHGHVDLIVYNQPDIPFLTTVNRLLKFSLSQHPKVNIFEEENFRPLVANLSLDPIVNVNDRVELATPLDANLVVTLTAAPTGNGTFLLDSTGYLMPANKLLFSISSSLNTQSMQNDLTSFSEEILAAIIQHTDSPIAAPDINFLPTDPALSESEYVSQNHLIEALQETSPNAPEGWLAGATLAWEEGRIGDAYQQLDTLAALPNVHEYWLLQGNFLKAQITDDLKLAQQTITRLTTLYPKNAKLLTMRAQTHIWADNIDAALKDYRQALSSSPKNAQLWFELARQQIINGDIESAIDEALTKSLILYRQQENIAGESLLLNAFGVAHLRLANYAVAQRYFSDSLALRTPQDFPSERVTSLANLANVAAIGGDYALAEDSLNEALELLEQLGDRIKQAHVLDTLGFLFEEQGRYQEALAYYKHGLDIRVQLKEGSKQAESMSNVAYMHFLMGDFSLADIYWRQAKTHFERDGDKTHLIRTIQNLAQLSLVKGDKLATSRSLASVATQLAPQQTQEHMYNQLLFSFLNFSEGKLHVAKENIAQALKLAHDMGDTRALSEVKLWQAEVCVYIADWLCVQEELGELNELVSAAMKEQQAVLTWLQIVVDIELNQKEQLHSTAEALPFTASTIPVLTELKILLDLQHRLKLPADSTYMKRINKLIKPAFYQAHMQWLYLTGDIKQLKQKVESYPNYWRNHIYYRSWDETKSRALLQQWLSKLNETQAQHYQRTYLERL